MERINGDANINAVRVAKEMGIPRFAYISTVENNLPILSGYFNGKKRAEDYLLSTYAPSALSILRPSMIYGTRMAGKIPIPLWAIGKPLDMMFNNSLVATLRKSLPFMQSILAPPVCVDDVANAALVGALGYDFFGFTKEERLDELNVMNVYEIKRVGRIMERKMKELSL
eukprot:gene23434-29652_t